MSDCDGKHRGAIVPGARVAIVQKQDQRTGRTVEGVVAAVLTRSATHPHGIKVRLVDGRVGRVKAVLDGDSASEARTAPTTIAPADAAAPDRRFTRKDRDR